VSVLLRQPQVFEPPLHDHGRLHSEGPAQNLHNKLAVHTKNPDRNSRIRLQGTDLAHRYVWPPGLVPAHDLPLIGSGGFP
jgi:hypothetical protein